MPGYKFLNGIDLSGQKATNAADASASTDLVTLQQMQNSIAGLNWKQVVRVATTTNGALATAFANGQSIDGISLVTGDRILIKNQTTGSENGIYTVNASGAPTRATDADSAADLNGAVVGVTVGTANADKAFQMVTDNVTLGTTALVWTPFAAGVTYTASNGVTLVGQDFRAVAGDATITVDASGIKVAAGAFVKKYSQDVGVMSAGTPVVITHNLNTSDVQVQTRIVSTGEIVDLGAIITGVNTVTVQNAAGAGAGIYRVVVEG